MTNADYFIDEFIKNDDKALLVVLTNGIMQSVFNDVEFSIQESFTRAAKKLWGEERHKISMRKVDSVLRQEE
jgi:hypothetical protein